MPNVKSSLGSDAELNLNSFESKFCSSVIPSLRQLKPYPAGKPIEETKRELGLKDVVKLASNENPLGPSPEAMKRVQSEILTMHLYPDAAQFSLRQALVGFFKAKVGATAISTLKTSNFIVGCGSNEIIDLLFRVFVPADAEIVTHEKSFAAYKLCAQLQGSIFTEVAVDEDFEVNTDRILNAVTEKTRVVILANPNNPTGRSVPKSKIENLAAGLLEKNILFVLDAAYEEFIDEGESFAFASELWSRFPNVVALYTFSKIYGLAGLRVGFGLAHDGVARFLNQARQPFNISALSAAAAEAALHDRDFVARSRDINAKVRSKVMQEIKALGFSVTPSRANFVLVDMSPSGKSGQECFEALLEKGFIVRPVNNYNLQNYIRISIGTQEEMDGFLAVFRQLFSKHVGFK